MKYYLDCLNSARDVFHYAFEGIDEHFTKFGEQRLDPRNWLMVIGEETGEVFADVNKGKWENAKHEIAQTIACYARLYYEIERVENGRAEQERELYSQSE